MSSIYNDAIYLDDIPKEQWKDYIGDGYRSVTYHTDADRNGRLIFRGFNKEGKPQTFMFPWKSYVKYNVKYQTNEKDIFDRYVETKWFNSKSARDKYVEQSNGLNIVECLKPDQEFLRMMFDDVVLNDDFNNQTCRVQYIDIETEISETFMKPSEAANRINMITIYDSYSEKFYTWTLQHVEVAFKHEPLKDMPKDKFVVFEFNDDEELLLQHFVNWIEDNVPDISVSYNGRAYDWPYIVRRIENVLGKNEARRLSPVGKYFIKEVNHDNKRADVAADIEVNIDGLFIADELVLYRDKFNCAGGTLDGGFSLDNVGEYEELGHKIKYEGSLKDLYLNDFQLFYEYNVRDVDLLKRIEDKRKLVPLARKVAGYGLCDYNQIYGSIKYLLGSVASFSKTQFGGKLLPTYLAEKKQFDSFEGAFVFPIVPGLYNGGIGTIDFASLYPSSIRAANISPETYVGKIIVQYKDELGKLVAPDEWTQPAFNIYSVESTSDPKIAGYILKTPNGKKQPITLDKIKELVHTKCIYTANNTLFLKHEIKWGVITKWCEHFYNLRKATKKKMLACTHRLQQEGDTLSDEEKAELKTLEERYESGQIALKLMINSIYGCMGNGWSAIADPNLAQSVTRQGKFCNISASKFILKRFIEKYGAPKDYRSVVGGDTDSQFVNLQVVTDWLRAQNDWPELLQDWSAEQKRVLWDTMSEFVEKEVNPFVRNLVNKYCKSSETSPLVYELEYMGDVGVYESKKHYALHEVVVEGDSVDKTKYTGIELKKGTVPKEMKTFLADIYAGVLQKKWKENDYEKYICELYDRFKDFSIDEISFWKGYSTERQSVGFLEMEVGTTGIAKACTYYNQLIQKLGIGKKYEEIRVGDKVRFCYIDKNNDYGINQIAYKPGQWPKEFAKLFRPDYRTMFNKVILDPLKKFRIACQFSEIDPSRQVQFDIFTL